MQASDLTSGTMKTMNSSNHVPRTCLVWYGVLTLFGAALHVWWHWRLRGLPEMDGLTPAQWGLVDTLNWSIIAICVMFSALAYLIVNSQVFNPPQVRALSRLMAAFWSVRLAIELINPVAVPLLPCFTSPILTVLLVAGIGLLLLPEAYSSDEEPLPFP